MSAQVLQFLGSLLAILALVGLAHWLGFSRPASLRDEDEARELFALAPGGFAVEQIALAKDGAGAIARDQRGKLAILKRHGGRFVAEKLPPHLALSADGETLCISTTPPVHFDLGTDAGAWARAVSPAS